MFNKAAEKTTGLLILFGAPFTSLFILFDSVTDPVNVTKMAAAGALGFSTFFIFVIFAGKVRMLKFKHYLIASGLFTFASISAVTQSDSPISQNLYGSYGRNTGLITYLILTMISIGSLLLSARSSFQRIIWGLQFTGLVNVLYCGWVILYGDFFPWTNPYGEILGFFGNPNFISSFLGVFISTLLATAFGQGASWKFRGAAAVVGGIAFYEVVDSNSIQGIVVTFCGIAVVLFFAVRAYAKYSFVSYLYLFLASSFGILALLGTLQKGPLSFIYKTSVSLRGEYWRAGIKMGTDNPFSGIGMDSYGDWYRRARSVNAATVLPGPKTVTNASHNVVIDFFAFGGLPLVIAYLAMLVLAAISIVRVIRRNRSYDAVFVSMVAAWLCYQVQSLISINQIGLAVWGWLITGALISYDYSTRVETDSLGVRNSKNTPSRANKGTVQEIISPQLVGGIGLVVGLVIASPPLSADMKWRTALNSKDANVVSQAFTSSYTNPLDSQRFAQGVQLFGNSNLMEQALQLARSGVDFNPSYFDAWRMLYFLPNSTEDEKAKALGKMQELDPNNPDVSDK